MQDKASRRTESWGTRGSLSSLISAGSWHSLILHWYTGCFPALEELIDEQCCTESQESTSPGWHAADSCQNAVSPWCLANGKTGVWACHWAAFKLFGLFCGRSKWESRVKKKRERSRLRKRFKWLPLKLFSYSVTTFNGFYFLWQVYIYSVSTKVTIYSFN